MQKFLAFLLIPLLLVSCHKDAATKSDHLVVTALNYPSYDAARAVLGPDADLRMLIPPATDVHSYEPSSDDVIRILNSDIFIYTGGESDHWLEGLLNDLDEKTHLFSLIEHSPVVYSEEHKEGMEEEEHSHSHIHEAEISESDEHVWTSLGNMAAIVEDLSSLIISLDSKNEEKYRENANSYIASILSLKDEISGLVESSKRKVIVFADRFPFLYFVREAGLDYYAAFPGCASGTEPSAKTVAFLIDTVKEKDIPVIFHIELSNTMLSNVIAEETGAEAMELNSAQNISRRDFNSGITYLDIMRGNLKALREALN